jgi:hypothetical protein
MWDEEDNKCDLEPRKNDEIEPNVAIFPFLHIALMSTVVKESSHIWSPIPDLHRKTRPDLPLNLFMMLIHDSTHVSDQATGEGTEQQISSQNISVHKVLHKDCDGCIKVPWHTLTQSGRSKRHPKKQVHPADVTISITNISTVSAVAGVVPFFQVCTLPASATPCVL